MKLGRQISVSPQRQVERKIAVSSDRKIRVTSKVRNLTGLRDYQVAGVRWLVGRDRALLCDEMGLGKTVQVLRALPSESRAIVVCPKYVKHVWRRQVELWCPELHASFGELRRPEPGEVLIVAYSELPERQTSSRYRLIPQSLSDVTVAFDEVHYCKSPVSQRGRSSRLLALQASTAWGTTGTPLLGNPADLWGVLFALDLHKRVFDDYQDFLAAFSARKDKWGNLQWGNVSTDVRERLMGDDGVMLRRMVAQVLKDLPKVSYIDHEVEAPPDLREYLDEMNDKWTEVDPTELPPFELLSAARAALARSRTQDAVDLVEELSKREQVVVFSAHVEPVQAMRAVRSSGVITGEVDEDERDRLVQAFQRGELQVLAGTIGAMGTGVTLTAGHVEVFVDQDYTPALNAQAVARCARLGQEHPVRVYRMLSAHPLDRRLLQILDEKQRLISATLGD